MDQILKCLTLFFESESALKNCSRRSGKHIMVPSSFLSGLKYFCHFHNIDILCVLQASGKNNTRGSLLHEKKLYSNAKIYIFLATRLTDFCVTKSTILIERDSFQPSTCAVISQTILTKIYIPRSAVITHSRNRFS